MDILKKQFGARIKELREHLGFNQEQLAEMVEMESRHISRIETGGSFTTLANIEKIAKALDVDIATLFTFKHKNDKEYLIKEINNYLIKADSEQIEMIYKVISAIMN